MKLPLCLHLQDEITSYTDIINIYIHTYVCKLNDMLSEIIGLTIAMHLNVITVPRLFSSNSISYDN